MKPINMSNKRLLLGRKNARMGYSAAYPTGRELIGDMDEANLILNTATLSITADFLCLRSMIGGLSPLHF